MAKRSKQTIPEKQNVDSENWDSIDAIIERQERELFTEGVVLHEPSKVQDGAEAAWVRLQGATPLEFLAMVYKNPFNSMNDRLSAAKAVLEYCHKKLPQKVEIDGKMQNTQKVTADSLSKLSDEELDLFTKLLSKLGS
jgi:hypothetical protein